MGRLKDFISHNKDFFKQRKSKNIPYILFISILSNKLRVILFVLIVLCLSLLLMFIRLGIYSKQKHIWAILFLLLLLVYIGYILLIEAKLIFDTFTEPRKKAIERVEE